LLFVVLRMMAKRPADRFQTAGQVAEALAPYLAVSSRALPQLRAASAWQGGQLTLSACSDLSAGRVSGEGGSQSRSMRGDQAGPLSRVTASFETETHGVVRDISGRWEGTARDLEIPGLLHYAIPLVPYTFEMTVRQTGVRFEVTGSVLGQAGVPQPFRGHGSLKEDGNYVVMEWVNTDPQMRDYGIALLEYTADAKRLEGFFLGRERLHGSNFFFGEIRARRAPAPGPA
jgi:hypothetical protein